MVINIDKSRVTIYSSGSVKINADMKDQSLSTLKRLGRGRQYSVKGASNYVLDYIFNGVDVSLWMWP